MTVRWPPGGLGRFVPGFGYNPEEPTRSRHATPLNSDIGAPRPPPAQHRAFASFAIRDYRILLLTATAAMMGDNIEHVISYWVMFQKFHSPALGAFAVVSHWVPYLLLGAFSGRLADRFDIRRLIQIGMLLLGGVSIGWGIMFMTDSATVWKAMVLLVIHGLAGVIWIPAGQVLIHRILSLEQLPSGVRLFATGRYMGFLVGPARRRRLAAGIRRLWRYFHQRADLCAALDLVGEGALRIGQFGRRGDAGGRQRLCRCLGDHAGGREEPGVVVDDHTDRRLGFLRRQCLSGANARIRRGSRPRQRGLLVRRASRRGCRGRTGGRFDPGEPRVVAPKGAYGIHPGDDLVLCAVWIRPLEYLRGVHQPFVRCRICRVGFQCHGTVAGAIECARRNSWARARSIFDVCHGTANL